MKARAVRLGLAAAIAAGVAAPTASQAFYCNPSFQAVCAVIGQGCAAVKDASNDHVRCAF